jgi:hypothetical protein
LSFVFWAEKKWLVFLAFFEIFFFPVKVIIEEEEAAGDISLIK